MQHGNAFPTRARRTLRFAFTMLLALCAATGASAATLNRGIGNDPDSLDPHKAIGTSSSILIYDLFEGLVTVFLRDQAGIDIFAGSAWIFELPGLVLVYSYFQIPLMVIVFLPALDGLRPQWREASESLGGTGWTDDPNPAQRAAIARVLRGEGIRRRHRHGLPIAEIHAVRECAKDEDVALVV